MFRMTVPRSRSGSIDLQIVESDDASFDNPDQTSGQRMWLRTGQAGMLESAADSAR